MKFEFNKKYTTIAVYVCLVVLFGIFLACLLMYSKNIMGFFSYALYVITPILYALALVLILVPLVDFFSLRMLKFLDRKKPHPKLRRGIAVALAYLCLLLVIGIVFLIIIPEITNSYEFLNSRMSGYITALEGFVDNLSDKYGFLGDDAKELFASFEETVLSSYTSLSALTPIVISFFNNLISQGSSILLGLIISIYAILDSRHIKAITKKLTFAVFSKSVTNSLMRFFRLLYENLLSFASGRVLYSLIVSAAFFVVTWASGMPFYSILTVLIFVCTIVPAVGPLVGGTVSALLVIITAPQYAIFFIVWLGVLYAAANRFIAPHTLKKSVNPMFGVSIIAVIIGGFIAGVWGMILSVPIYTTIREFFADKVTARLKEKGIENEE